MSVEAEWIAVDWGTSHLRVWAMQGTRAVGEARSDKGMGRLARSEFQGALLELAADWLDDTPVDVIACGMVGARQGWVEAPYATVPVAPLSGAPIRVPGTDPRLRAYVVPGLKQAKPADVMRGEETQIAGFLALNKDWDGVICLPGTHSKWVHVSAGEVVSFQTFMTGEMFDLLSKSSVLRHSVGEGWDDEIFREAVETTLSKPESMAARLFGIRASDLLEATDGAVSRARLSGLLIGAELAAARPYWLGQQIALIGASQMSAIYAKALELQGVPATIADGQQMTLAGLNAARKLLEH
ncbi:2-dehydro-3-deoxygalactonokinase [Ruegeria jejuensis]|uniref:2-dehydro-3-deoxygalactonokinase n=1 Tax=Ruegeria jejuensis TaxID=3233338 RepID=UPI00355C7859